LAALGRRQTLSEFLASTFSGNTEYDGLAAVITAIAKGSYKVHQQVQQAALADTLGATNEINVQGEIVQRLDSSSSEIFVEALQQSERVAIIGCEEIENPVIAGANSHQAYMVLMDPLDGSSNIDVAVSIGSIFGIWRRNTSEPIGKESLLRPGNEQIAAAYVVYGSSTVLVIATHGMVQGFTMDPYSGIFSLTHADISIPEQSTYYSMNEGNFNTLDHATQEAVINLRDTHSQRYVGSLVADFHRNLLKGGIFLYPADRNRPEGRLRLMYEANPLGFIVEQAGGAASNGEERIMDIWPRHLHQRTPLILGNKAEVEQTVATIRQR
jgi:fructose-1,6-bisphosphatase I